MRDLMVATLAVLLLIGAWLVFFHYSEDQLNSYVKTVNDIIIPTIEEEDWDRSVKELKALSKDWHQYKKVALFFLDTDTISQIDYALSKSIKYAQAEDISNSTGELNAMVEQIRFLISNDQVSLDNIF